MQGYDPHGSVDAAPAPDPPPAQPAPDPPRRRPVRWRAARALSLLCALALAYGGAVVWAYDVSRDQALTRAKAPRLEVRPEHRSAPYDANFERNFWVALEDVPPSLVAAILHREDRRFRAHPGVDPRGLGRAVAAGGAAGGGSTITQQVAKLLFVGRSRTPLRKVEELFVALWLDAILTKDELLEVYLNVAYFGRGVRGVEAAARAHFGLSFLRSRAEAARFDAVMAAQLALALPQPTGFDPRDATDAPRVAALLAELRAAGAPVGAAPTDAAGVRRAIRERRRAAGPDVPVASHHRDMSVEQVFRVAAGRVATWEAAPFLRADHQLYLERTIQRLREDGALARAHPHALGYVIDVETGGVTAQAGRAARVYAGSLTKPLIQLCAHLRGVGPGATVVDEPYGDPPQIENRGRKYFGRLPLDRALAQSVNSVYARLLDEHGVACLAEAARAVGAPMWLEDGGKTGRVGRRTMALGAAPVETAAMLDFYLAVASCGRRAAHAHVAATWRPGRWGSGWRAPPAAEPDPATRAALSALQAAMAGAARTGTARGLVAFPGPVAAKTGTDDEGRQFGLVAFTGRWLVYLSFWADGPQPGPTRAGGSLAPAAAQLLRNLHIDAPSGPLSCDAAAATRVAAN